MTRAARWGRRSPDVPGVHRDLSADAPTVVGPPPVAAGPGAPPAGAGPDDDLAGELAAVAGRRWWNRATLYLGAAVLLIGGFAGGVQVQKSYGNPAGTGPAAATGRGAQRGAAGFPGFPGAAGRPGATGTAAGADTETGTAQSTTGTVKLVDGTTVYLQTADGTVITVRTGADTAVAIARSGSLSDLRAGDTVTVDGPNSAGTVTATRVTAQSK
ncbi:hypothetical protein OG792_26340 [Micromonospora sp. NBC_01699]|uniref:hypothetical protein n=1 Tax=Micromonospora sp. NBC_01699 TaxID=2975984 RepID=UPI002E2BA74A|nr:hypothetical protein [Micromonospora sp. NBC_01699]